jgi:hypothetical protein
MTGLEQVREGSAPAALAGRFREIRRLLRVPWVPLFYRALAPMPDALQAAWPALAPNVETRAFEEAADDLRVLLTRTAVELGTPLLEPMLLSRGYDVDEIDEMRDALQLFHYVDPKLMLVTGGLVQLDEGRFLGGARRAEWALEPVPPALDLPSPMLAPERPGGRVGEILDALVRAIHLPDVTADLRVLGHWPGLLEESWDALSTLFARPALEPSLTLLRAEAHAAWQRMPHRVAPLADDAMTPSHHARYARLLRQFDDAGPRLALFAAALRVSLEGPENAMASPFPIDWPPADLEAPP